MKLMIDTDSVTEQEAFVIANADEFYILKLGHPRLRMDCESLKEAVELAIEKNKTLKRRFWGVYVSMAGGIRYAHVPKALYSQILEGE